MSAVGADTGDRGRRRTRIVDAALEVLAAQGARGLTHRATDRAADLAEGSTSNYFRTREALLEAALRRHLELDLGAPPERLPPIGSELSTATARNLVLAAIERILEPSSRTLLIARYELFLEATRRPSLHAELDSARGRFVDLAEGVLAGSGCSHPRLHAAQLVACVDGLLLDQVLAGRTSLDRGGIEDAVDRLLATC